MARTEAPGPVAHVAVRWMWCVCLCTRNQPLKLLGILTDAILHSTLAWSCWADRWWLCETSQQRARDWLHPDTSVGGRRQHAHADSEPGTGPAGYRARLSAELLALVNACALGTEHLSMTRYKCAHSEPRECMSEKGLNSFMHFLTTSEFSGTFTPSSTFPG